MSGSKLNYSEVREQLENTGQSLYLPETYVSKQDALYEDNSSCTSSKDFVIGAFVGGVIGAAVALFLAPKSGKDLRNDVKVKSSDITSQAKQKSSELTKKVQEQAAPVVKKVQEQAAPVVNKVKSLKGNNVTPPLDDGTAFADGEDQMEFMETVENTIHEYEKTEKDQH
ncbi:YtxH domain-containing protein [Kurthia gibsonii]|uniref:YtxH domain-containing protein n=1 Tax=Kurthia gibsonii TaxID=33946 RepID=UPI0031B67667